MLRHELIYDHTALIYYYIPLCASVDDEFPFVVSCRLLVVHTLDCVCLEITEVLVDESIVFNVSVLPLTMSPGRETARARAHLLPKKRNFVDFQNFPFFLLTS